MSTNWNLFVYGSLAPSGSHHLLLRPWLMETNPATAPGCLYEDDDGFPFLHAPHEAILAKGSGDLMEDLSAWHIVRDALQRSGRNNRGWHGGTDGDQPAVEGYLLTLCGWPGPVPLMDEWEEFLPPARCVYHRVITHVRITGSCANAHVPAWTYVREPEEGSVPIGKRWIPRTFS